MYKYSLTSSTLDGDRQINATSSSQVPTTHFFYSLSKLCSDPEIIKQLCLKSV